MKKFYHYNNVKDLSGSAQRAFERSYDSYVKYFNKMKKPANLRPLSKQSYLQDYKSMRNDLEDLDMSLKSIPRDIAKEQKMERSLYQDYRQHQALKDLNLERYKKMTFAKFRQLSEQQIKEDLFDEIESDRTAFLSMSEEERRALAGTTDVNIFISRYYFGSE